MANSTVATAQQKIQEKVFYDFMGNRNIAFIFSIVLIVLGIGSMILKGGLASGIDFAGGTLVSLRFSDLPAIDAIRSAVSDAGFKDAVIQRIGDGHDILVRVPNQETTAAEATGQEQSERILAALRTKLGNTNFTVLQTNQVGPQVGQELRRSAQFALLFAIAGMVMYISWRFESKLAMPVLIIGLVLIGLSSWKWLIAQEYGIPLVIILALASVLVACIFFEYHFALAAIVALIHDVLITTGALSLTNRELSLPIVAALLAIIGYSVNDTIIIFDRIRENLHLMNRQDSEHLLNRSIIQTLTRTTLTSLTTLFTVAMFYFLGGPVINNFAFTLLVGIAIGTYSSIFIVTPILYIWNQRVKGGIFKKV